MTKYIIRRLLLIIPVLLGAVVLVFTINYFSTTDPAMIKLGISASDVEKLTAMREEMGLNDSYIVQLGRYIWRLLHGDLGDSYVYAKSVWELVSSRVPNTLKLSLSAMVVSVIIGIPLGLIAALRQNTAVDYSLTVFAVLMQAVPAFLIAVVLMLVFAVKLKWFPVSGAETWKHFVLPLLASCFTPAATNARMTRSAVLEVIRQDYIRTARAKGLEERRVIWKHVFQNALIPILTMVGNSLGHCLAGSVLVEMIFNIPGMGMLMNSSIMSKDFITVQSSILICAIVVALANLLTDLAYAFVDPRIRAQYSGQGSRKKKTAVSIPKEA